MPRRLKMLDDSAAESKAEEEELSEDEDEKRGRPKKKKAKGIHHQEQKKMLAAVVELPYLLQILWDPDTKLEHYQFPHDNTRKLFAEAFKWAYSLEEEKQGTGYKNAYDTFWTWWSVPMHKAVNPVWKAKLEEDPDFDKKKVIEAYAQRWRNEFDAAFPNPNALFQVRGWVRKQLGQEGVLLNPKADDSVIAKIALEKLSKEFIITSPDGASIVWDNTTKLWIAREKSRSFVALGELLIKLVEKREIIFSDDKADAAFRYKIQNGQIQSVLTWLRGLIPVFPPAVKNELNRATWMVPLGDGKLVDLRDLNIRERMSDDLFTVATNAHWLKDHKKTVIMDGKTVHMTIMDSKNLAEFKERVAEGIDHQTDYALLAMLQGLCPNAYKFIQGPFPDDERFWPFLLRLGASLSAHGTRKSMWLFGDGKGLKSTVLSAFMLMLGPLAVPIAKKVIFSTGREDAGHNTDLMRAESKRFLFIDELEKKDRLRETMFKLIVSQQPISGREIYGGQLEFKPMGTLWIATNSVPAMEFTDSSIPDRMTPFHVKTKIFKPSDHQKDLPPHYKDAKTWVDGYDDEKRFFWKLGTLDQIKWADNFMKGENEGGHQWELGCLLLLAGHIAATIILSGADLPVTPVMEEDRERFFKEADHVSEFVDDCLTIDKEWTTEFKIVWQEYQRWCKEQNITTSKMKILQQSLRQKGLMVEIRKRGGGKQLAVKALIKSSQVEVGSIK
jgi:hypothetical protein